MLRISGDIAGNTVALVLDDGEQIQNVSHATIELDANDWNRVSLEIIGVSVNVEAGAEGCVFRCQLCDHSEEHKCSDALSPPAAPNSVS